MGPFFYDKITDSFSLCETESYMGLCLRGVSLHWPISSPSIYVTHTNIHTYTGLRHRSVLTTSTCSIYPFGPPLMSNQMTRKTSSSSSSRPLMLNQMTRKHLFILKVLRIPRKQVYDKYDQIPPDAFSSGGNSVLVP